MDARDLDVVLSSSSKAFALPPGLAFCAVSDRAMEKAKTVPNRGYYFDFLTLAKSMAKNQTPATPAVSLLYALDLQLDKMMAEGMEARFARHMALRDMTLAWAKGHGFEIYAAEDMNHRPFPTSPIICPLTLAHLINTYARKA
ncbi:MAG: hypothetical protein R3C44_08555 [Chloroflexota bacterium]